MNAKAYMEYTLGDILRLDYTFLIRDKSDEAVASQKEAIAHIIRIANQAGANPFHWKIMELFPMAYSTNSIITDKGKLTGLILKHISFEKENNHADRNRYMRSKRLIERRGITYSKSTLSSLKSKVLACERSMDSLMEDYHRQLGERLKHQKDILHTIDNNNTTWCRDVERVLHGGYWKFFDMENSNTVRFFNKAPIRQIIPNAELLDGVGVDWDLNFGHFLVSYNMANQQVRVRMGCENLNTSYWHPSISSSGYVCWGDSSADIEALMLGNSTNMFKILEILKNILHTYSTHSPYRPCSDFKNDQDTIGTNKRRRNSSHGELLQERLTEFSDVVEPEPPEEKYWGVGDDVRITNVKVTAAPAHTIGKVGNITSINTRDYAEYRYYVQIEENNWSYAPTEFQDPDLEFALPVMCHNCDNTVDDCCCDMCADCDRHYDDCTCNLCSDCDNDMDECICEAEED